MGLMQSNQSKEEEAAAAAAAREVRIAGLVSQLDAAYPDALLASASCDFEKNLLPSPHYTISQHWLALGTPLQWLAFGQLPFLKRHLILKYFPENICMQMLSTEYFHMFKSMELYAMESLLQHKSLRFDKIRSFHEGSQVTGVHFRYTCEIDKDAHVSSMDMMLECEGRPLQRAFGYDNVLQVYFGFTKDEGRDALHLVFMEGLEIGLRTYKFYGLKDDQHKKKGGISKECSSGYKCVFLCLRSEAEYDLKSKTFRSYATMHDARQYLGHFHTVSKLSTRISRMKLALSKTLQIKDLNFSEVTVEEIDDIYCKDDKGRPLFGTNGEALITTNGSGFISENLMKKCPLVVFQGNKLATDDFKEDYPLLMQMRLFYRGNIYKGVFLVNKQLPPNTIQVRPSMRKVENDSTIFSSTFNSLEVCATSRRPAVAGVFRHLVLLLLNGGVPENVFMRLAVERLEDLSMCFKKLRRACRALEPHIAERSDCQIAFKMLLAELKVEEPFIASVLTDLRSAQLTDLSKCHFPVEGTYYLKGCADPTGILAPSQVFILKDQPVVAEEVLVYKPPGLHPGDVCKFRAMPPPPALREIVGFAKFGIFFSVLGERSDVDKMANADLDGDEFWICENQEIIRHFQVSPPWTVPKENRGVQPKEAPREPEAFEREHVKMCIDALLTPSSIKGQASNAWLALMDKYIWFRSAGLSDNCLMLKCLRLVDIYYEALDAEKTGRKVPCLPWDLRNAEKPHFMDPISARNYVSPSLLGQVYDMVKNPSTLCYVPTEVPIELDKQFFVSGYEQYYNKWCKLLKLYNKDMKKACLETNSHARNLLCEAVVHKYRQILYGALDMASSTHDLNQIHMEACALYIAVYSQAQKNQWNGSYTSLRFAWIVAGDALLDIIKKPGWWTVSPIIMRAVYGRAGLEES